MRAKPNRWRRQVGRCCVVTASLAAVAWPAAAATVEVRGQSLYFEGATGEINDLTVSMGLKSRLTVSDPEAPITTGAGCSPRSAHTVSCSAKGIKLIVASGGDLDDTLFNDTRVPSRLDGGDGEDWVVGGSRADRLYGGDGTDRLSGRGGKDTIRARGLWADAIRCGGGRDTVFADWRDSVRPSCESVDRPAAP
jgi:serralysin